MYLTFYGLKEKPFNATPDPQFLYLTPGHRPRRRKRGGTRYLHGLARFMHDLPSNIALASQGLLSWGSGER